MCEVLSGRTLDVPLWTHGNLCRAVPFGIYTTKRQSLRSSCQGLQRFAHARIPSRLTSTTILDCVVTHTCVSIITVLKLYFRDCRNLAFFIGFHRPPTIIPSVLWLFALKGQTCVQLENDSDKWHNVFDGFRQQLRRWTSPVLVVRIVRRQRIIKFDPPIRGLALAREILHLCVVMAGVVGHCAKRTLNH